ncbi:MAG: hypothetical protein ACJAWH_001279 [Maribacter sp.]|jgi:hypothetical protein
MSNKFNVVRIRPVYLQSLHEIYNKLITYVNRVELESVVIQYFVRVISKKI